MHPHQCVEILRPLEPDEVKELLNLYEQKYGNTNFHYLLLYNQLKWNRNMEDLGVHKRAEAERAKWNGLRKAFYTHRDGDFRKYGTYISLHFDLIQSVSFNSWEPGLNELYDCLEETNLIDWASGPLLTNVGLEYCDRVKEIAASKGIRVQRARLCCGFIMSQEKALKIEVPCLADGFELRELEVEHARLIHDVWPNKKEGSFDYISGLIQVNKSFGVFRLSDGALVAWVIQNDFSGLGFLQTQPEAQRLGLGRVLTTRLCKAIAETEKVVINAWTVSDNYKSQALLEKVGLGKTVLNEWIQLKRKDE